MRLLLVDNSSESLDVCTQKLQELSPDLLEHLQLACEVSAINKLQGAAGECDILFLGPELADDFAGNINSIQATHPHIPILAFCSDDKEQEIKFKDSEEFQAVFSLDISIDELEAELSSFIEEQSDSVDQEVAAASPDFIIGRYQVIEEIGAGSIGTVYACLDTLQDNKKVAVKVLYPEVAQDATAVARCSNEYFGTYNLCHPNVVKAYDFIQKDGQVVVSMEYVEGTNLAKRLDDFTNQLSIEEIKNLLCQILSGVQAMHDGDIIHRNLKPENIFLCPDGIPKISDSGIARTETGGQLTHQGGVLGAVHYIAPEYMLESKVDWRSDIYGVGVLAYEMLTGQPPFMGKTIYEVMQQCLKGELQPPCTLRGDCPQELSNIIVRALSSDPEERYQSAAEMFNDLKCMNGHQTNSFLVVPDRVPDASRRVVPTTIEFGDSHSLTDPIEFGKAPDRSRLFRPEIDTSSSGRLLLFVTGGVLVGLVAAFIFVAFLSLFLNLLFGIDTGMFTMLGNLF